MAKLAVSSTPQKTKIILVGNIEFLEHLKDKYGKRTSIQDIIKKERGLLND